MCARLLLYCWYLGRRLRRRSSLIKHGCLSQCAQRIPIHESRSGLALTQRTRGRVAPLWLFLDFTLNDHLSLTLFIKIIISNQSFI